MRIRGRREQIVTFNFSEHKNSSKFEDEENKNGVHMVSVRRGTGECVLPDDGEDGDSRKIYDERCAHKQANGTHTLAGAEQRKKEWKNEQKK